MKMLKIAWVLAALLVVLAGCSAPSVPSVTGSRVGNFAPDFNLFNLGGERVSLASFAGRTVVVTFWATD